MLVLTRILHTADLHLDSPLKSLALRDGELQARVEAATRAALARIVDIALSEKVAAVLIVGDLFDGAERSARTAAFLLGELARLRIGEVPVFFTSGAITTPKTRSRAHSTCPGMSIYLTHVEERCNLRKGSGSTGSVFRAAM